MQNLNPYAPPKSVVTDVGTDESAPTIWNPSAAANWSLLFSPIFGATLQMMNWQALGEPEKADSSKKWAIFSIIFFVLLTLSGFVFPEVELVNALSRPLSLALLFSWYFASARIQQRYVKEKFGQSYPRKGWLKPLLLAIVAVIGLIVVTGLIGFAMDAMQ